MPTKKPKEKKKYYYHITTFEGWQKIGDEGVKASKDGYIYILDTNDYAVCVTLIRKLTSIEPFPTIDRGFGLIRIDPAGFTSPIESDEDGKKYDVEFTLSHQFQVKQAFVEPKYLKRLNMQHIIDPVRNLDTREFFKN